MAEYYTLETLRDQILQKGWNVSTVLFSPGNVRQSDASNDFPNDWKYCPCSIKKQCIQRQTKACFLRVGISTNNKPTTETSLFIEIIFLRERQTGFIRTDQMLLKHYIDAGTINREALEIITT